MNVRIIIQKNIFQLQQNGFLENESIEIVDTPILKYSWLATKLLRYAFINNIYVFTSKNFMTNSLGVIPVKEVISNEFLETCEKLNLCRVVYNKEPTSGFELINTTKKEDKYKEMYDAPNHIKVVNCNINQMVCKNI